MAIDRDIFNQKPTITGWNWGGFAFPLAIGIVVKSPILIVLQFVPLIGQIIGGIIANAEIDKLLNYPYEIVEEFKSQVNRAGVIMSIISIIIFVLTMTVVCAAVITLMRRMRGGL